ncbi:hypothetical protein BV25DRAFT_1722855 [Artomyces pyxidatus]|uniref:Uncharacterized protein n=1 Tax=Artomyces pyxidatus TaxID=48021 RepID=A0ACB8SJ86_9AGAM|nr:hypothetical protein BV25DRAFT_1722855 [Artomyces pyxidatus]
MSLDVPRAPVTVTMIRMLSLPNEILLRILENLEYKDVLTCRETCRTMDSMITTFVPLQYTIELAACGMLDGEGGPHTLDVHERLKLLKLYDEAWRKLHWTEYSDLNHLVGRIPPPQRCWDSAGAPLGL